jgi:hypothetical protein
VPRIAELGNSIGRDWYRLGDLRDWILLDVRIKRSIIWYLSFLVGYWGGGVLDGVLELLGYMDIALVMRLLL